MMPRKKQEEEKTQQKLIVLGIFRRENIAVILSLAAFIVSFLSYQKSIREPSIFASGTVEIKQDNQNSIGLTPIIYKSRIEIYNLGNKVATNVNLSVWNIPDDNAKVDISPEKLIDIKFRSSTIFISIPEIEAGKSVIVYIWDTRQPSNMPPATAVILYGPPYFIHVSSQEGSSTTTIIGLDVTSTVTPIVVPSTLP